MRKFLTSVASVFAYDENDNIVFTGKTLLDSSIEVSLGSAPVRGGRGNQLQYIYYHTGEMKFTLTDTQWNLGMLGATVGADETLSNNTYVEETVSATVSSNTVTATATLGTPLAWAGGATIYGWATTPAGNTIKGTFSGTSFTATKASTDTLATGNKICLRYYLLDTSANSITISANMIPKVVKLIMETQLNSADVTANRIGIVQIIAPTVTLSGAFSISMKADGVANTPLTATALAYNEPSVTAGCSATPYYAKVIEIIDSANWYDNVIGLSVEGGDFDIAKSGTSTLVVWAIPSSGAAFKVLSTAGNSMLTFAFVGSPASGATIGEHTGLFTASTTAGDSVVKVSITDAPTIDTTVTVTITA